MRLAISNIAWEAAEDDEVKKWLLCEGVDAVEIAPTRTWGDPSRVTAAEAAEQFRIWEREGLRTVAMQALLFGKPQFALFGEPEQRTEMLDYLKAIIRLGGAAGAGALVFGSPKNRLRGSIPMDKARKIAAEFFNCAGETAVEVGTLLCIEPNPAAYSCDFVNTAAEGAELVRETDHPGFKLHLDASAMKLNQEEPEAAIAGSFDCIAHFHISEPFLAPVGDDEPWHRRLASTLRGLGYKGYVSIEMRAGQTGENLSAVQKAVRFARRVYGT